MLETGTNQVESPLIRARIDQVARDLDFSDSFFANADPQRVRRFHTAVAETAANVEADLGIPRLNFELDLYMKDYPGISNANAHYNADTNTVGLNAKWALQYLLPTGASRLDFNLLGVKGTVAHEGYHGYVAHSQSSRIKEAKQSHRDTLKSQGRKIDAYYDDPEQHNADAYAYFYVTRTKTRGLREGVAKLIARGRINFELSKFHRRGVHSTS